MSDNKLKLARDTIRQLLDVLEPPALDSNYVERLAKKKDVTEAAEVVYASLEKAC